MKTVKQAIEELDKNPNEALWKEIDEALAEIENKRPPNSFTIPEFAARKGITRDIAAKRVRKLVIAGKAVKQSSGTKTCYTLVDHK